MELLSRRFGWPFFSFHPMQINLTFFNASAFLRTERTQFIRRVLQINFITTD